MAEIELEPCPFCGRDTGFQIKPVWKTYKFVACQCKAAGPVAKSDEEVAAAWNQRTKTLRQREIDNFARELLMTCNFAWQGVPPTRYEYIKLYQQAKELGLLDERQQV